MPQKVGRYRILELVGAGSMGIVYKAFDPILDRPVAIKTIRFDVLLPRLDYKRFTTRFYQEARISGTLSHPNIVSLYDMGETHYRMPFLAMEYVEGKTLRELLAEGEPVFPERRLALLWQMARAIDYAHGKGVIHRDIKPSNVIVEYGAGVKVTDFGIAKLIHSQLTQSQGSQLGTPGYMSPEQVIGESLDGRSDIFSLGVVAFEMLSGEPPFPGPHVAAVLHRIVYGEPVCPSNLEGLGLVPDKWHEVFSKVLAKDPKQRFATAGEFVRELVAVCLDSRTGFSQRADSRAGASPMAAEHSPLDRPDETLTLPPRPSARSSWRKLGVAAVSGLTLTMGLMFLGTSAPEPEPNVDLSRATLPGPRSLWLPDISGNGPENVTGSIAIDTDPRGATVLLNGRVRGVTPLELPELALGAHSILVDMEDHQTVDLAVLLTPEGRQTTLNIPLKAVLSPEAAEAATSGSTRNQSEAPSGLVSRQSPQSARLAVGLRLEGKQLLLKNENQFDWVRVKLKLSDPGIILSIERIQAGHTYTIIHPPTLKPQPITIWCDTPAGKGLYSAVLNP